MADKNKKDVKVVAVNVVFDPSDISTHIHWGVKFAHDDGKLVATLPADSASSMIEYGRVVKA